MLNEDHEVDTQAQRSYQGPYLIFLLQSDYNNRLRYMNNRRF